MTQTDQLPDQFACLDMDVKFLIQLPKGEMEDEWIAYNIYKILDVSVLLTTILNDVCKCPEMNAGATYQYTWTDDNGKQLQISAIQYIENVIAFSKQQLGKTNIFPVEPGKPFSHQFKKYAAQIMRRLLRIYIHCYHAHNDILDEYTFRKQFNFCLQFVVAFGIEFKLLNKEDIQPIKLLVSHWGLF